MSDVAAARPDVVAFLQWALPRLRLRWAGFRKVRGQVAKRLRRRLGELGLPDLAAYRERLESEPREWKVLESLCRVTITRFWRDRATWEALVEHGLPHAAGLARARGHDVVRAWSAGCASGEEAGSLLLAWSLGGGEELAGLELDVLATDTDEHLLERARRGAYPEGVLSDLPEGWREAAFDSTEAGFVLKPGFRRGLQLERCDLRGEAPDGGFELVLCRNIAFTYFEEALQREVVGKLAEALVRDGLLVLGSHERLPAGQERFARWSEVHPHFWRRVT